jgi:hypothetical protein
MPKTLSARGRLLMRQNRDSYICIYSGHAKDILGVPDLHELVELINKALDKGLLKRRPDSSARLDAKEDKNGDIELYLTEKGKIRAATLEALHGPFRPRGAIH